MFAGHVDKCQLEVVLGLLSLTNERKKKTSHNVCRILQSTHYLVHTAHDITAQYEIKQNEPDKKKAT